MLLGYLVHQVSDWCTSVTYSWIARGIGDCTNCTRKINSAHQSWTLAFALPRFVSRIPNGPLLGLDVIPDRIHVA